LRRRLIEYALDPEATMRALEREERRVQSEFERQVMRRLVARGYRVRAQWSVGYYRIDLVVEGGGKRLAIECDGDR
jgi:very-short-patch-repair endonuclease